MTPILPAWQSQAIAFGNPLDSDLYFKILRK